VWLSQNLPAMISAVGPNGLVILTWDEDDSSQGNRILTVFRGQLVIPGATSNRSITHYSVVRTICDALGLPPMAAAAFDAPITDVWQSPVASLRDTWGALKIRYH
jgi:acid phosphatase